MRKYFIFLCATCYAAYFFCGCTEEVTGKSGSAVARDTVHDTLWMYDIIYPPYDVAVMGRLYPSGDTLRIDIPDFMWSDSLFVFVRNELDPPNTFYACSSFTPAHE